MELVRLPLDGVRVTTVTGQVRRPYKGQSVWCYPYGRSAEDMQRLRVAAISFAHGKMLAEGFAAVCDFLSDEIVKWDVMMPRTGEACDQPIDGAAVARAPDEVVAYLITKIMGVEMEGEGSGGSAASVTESTETDQSPTS